MGQKAMFLCPLQMVGQGQAQRKCSVLAWSEHPYWTNAGKKQQTRTCWPALQGVWEEHGRHTGRAVLFPENISLEELTSQRHGSVPVWVQKLSSSVLPGQLSIATNVWKCTTSIHIQMEIRRFIWLVPIWPWRNSLIHQANKILVTSSGHSTRKTRISLKKFVVLHIQYPGYKFACGLLTSLLWSKFVLHTN